MKRLLATPLALVLSVSAFAHNGMDHVLGKVAAVHDTSIDVQAKTGKITTVGWDGKTQWMRGGVGISPRDIPVGTRVVIHAKHVDGKLLAAEVEVAPADAPAAGAH